MSNGPVWSIADPGATLPQQSIQSGRGSGPVITMSGDHITVMERFGDAVDLNDGVGPNAADRLQLSADWMKQKVEVTGQSSAA